MTIKTILRAAERFVTDNSPGILTGLAVAGTVTTAVLAGKAGYSTALLLQTDWAGVGGEPTRKQEIQMVWKEFIPAAVSGVATVTCVIAANHIGTRRTAAIAAAFKLSEQLTEEYKERVIKTLGAQKEEKLRSELAADRMGRVDGAETIIISGPEVVFYDELSGRFFKNEMENVRKAVNDINFKINNYFHASLTDFYDLIGLNGTSFSDEVGWNTDELLDMTYSATLLQDGRPAIAISFNTTPIRGYDRCQ
jgi:hypothetical protein